MFTRKSSFLGYLAYLALVSLVVVWTEVSSAFILAPNAASSVGPRRTTRPARVSSLTSSSSSSSVDSSETSSSVFSVSLEKPLGLILEEVQEGQACGVYVKELAEAGSALAYPRPEQIVGATLSKVGGTDVTASDFDAVMGLLQASAATVELEFIVQKEEPVPAAAPPVVEYAVGTQVTLTVQQKDGEDLIIQAKVGDNLRQVLLDNGFEVYQGLKQKLGNCGGAGQCTFCAVDFVESEGWNERSEYEDQKLGKFATAAARLACLNNIQGPATIRKTER